MAWRFTVSLGHEVKSWSSLITLNASYWYVWALFTPAIIWLSQHFRFERQGLWRALLVHLPSVIIFSLTHIVAVASVQWWLARTMGRPFGWWSEVAEVGASQLRLGDDDLLDDRRPQPRRPLLPRVQGPGPAHVSARDPARRGAAQDAAAAAAPALPLQHAARHLGADASRRRGRRSDADAAERPPAPDARAHRPAGDPARRPSSTSSQSISRSSRRASPIASSCASTSSPKRSTRWCRT